MMVIATVMMAAGFAATFGGAAYLLVHHTPLGEFVDALMGDPEWMK